MTSVFFHADDYGINNNQAMRILACGGSGGVLNSVSIMPNSECLKEVIGILPNDIKKSIHINLAEGHPCADPQEITLLLKDGLFYHSFLSLLVLSMIKPRMLRKQLQIEISAQLNRVIPFLGDDYRIRIDSHIHYHMIPVVFKAMCQAINECDREVEYIRYPNEKFSLYFKSFAISKVRLINIIKALLLKLFSLSNWNTIKSYGFQERIGVFFGVLYTGEMYGSHVSKVLNRYKRYAEKLGVPLEVLFHPGGIDFGEEFLVGSNDELKKFYCSESRRREAKMLGRLNNDESLSGY